MRARIARGAALPLLLAGLAACGGGEQAADKGGATVGAAKQAGAAGDDGRIRIAVIAKSSNNPVFLAARTGAEAAAKEITAQPGGRRWRSPG